MIKKLLSAIFYIFMTLVFASVLLVLLAFGKVEVSGDSMDPILKDNEYGLTDNWTFKLFGLGRFDIVTFERNDKVLVKRVIGLPNEKVFYDETGLYINDQYVEEDFIADNVKIMTVVPCALTQTGIILGDDEYFVLGDNRGNSSDSRFFGPIKKEQIKSRGLIIYGDDVDGKKVLKTPRFVGW